MLTYDSARVIRSQGDRFHVTTAAHARKSKHAAKWLPCGYVSALLTLVHGCRYRRAPEGAHIWRDKENFEKARQELLDAANPNAPKKEKGGGKKQGGGKKKKK